MLANRPKARTVAARPSPLLPHTLSLSLSPGGRRCSDWDDGCRRLLGPGCADPMSSRTDLPPRAWCIHSVGQAPDGSGGGPFLGGGVGALGHWIRCLSSRSRLILAGRRGYRWWLCGDGGQWRVATRISTSPPSPLTSTPFPHSDGAQQRPGWAAHGMRPECS
jgi:hypothetical protein